jgi:hypothetical protein
MLQQNVLLHLEDYWCYESHRLEEEIVKLVGISIPRKKLKKYIPKFEITTDYGYDDVTKWLEFLYEIEKKIAINIGKLNDEYAAEAALFLIPTMVTYTATDNRRLKRSPICGCTEHRIFGCATHWLTHKRIDYDKCVVRKK